MEKSKHYLFCDLSFTLYDSKVVIHEKLCMLIVVTSVGMLF